MAVALDSYLRQHHELGFATMTVDAIRKHLCHIHSYSPMVECPVQTWRFRDIIAVIYNNRYVGELLEVFGRDGFCLQYSIRVVALDRCWNFAFREYEIAARFISCHCLYTVALDGCQPTRTTPCEWVTRIPSPDFSNTAATALAITSGSKSPVLGVICRKNCSKLAESSGN